MSNLPEIVISKYDLQRLETLLEKQKAGDENAAKLEDELARAKIVAQSELPDGVVTMNSRVRFEIIESGKVFEKRLCYPEERVNEHDDISVLTAVGSSLIGLSEGATIPWSHNGKPLTVRVTAVFPPAA
ncbi:nucleoside diphosphate kinase regulator [Pseudidiomarina salilacus]|uniref:nucleoside diphosphate kinase regulator n=1 Tax=Pseudidiomarina salilacus TaxID=3384452 RepID=UPI003985663B